MKRRANSNASNSARAMARPTQGGMNCDSRSRVTLTPRQCGDSSRSNSPRALRMAAAVRSRKASS
ncbi:hypothetical protein D3C79_908950 [compost metagenome]